MLDLVTAEALGDRGGLGRLEGRRDQVDKGLGRGMGRGPGRGMARGMGRAMGPGRGTGREMGRPAMAMTPLSI